MMQCPAMPFQRFHITAARRRGALEEAKLFLTLFNFPDTVDLSQPIHDRRALAASASPALGSWGRPSPLQGHIS